MNHSESDSPQPDFSAAMPISVFVRNNLAKYQSPKRYVKNANLRNMRHFCRDCRRDVPVALITGRYICESCLAERDRRVAEHAARIECEEMAEVEAGRAFVNPRGWLVYVESGD